MAGYKLHYNEQQINPDRENLHIKTFKAPLGTVQPRKPTKADYHLYLINKKVQSINSSKHHTWKYQH